MALAPRVRIGFLSGYMTTTTCQHVVITLTDPTSLPVTVSIDGTDYVSGTDFTLTERGTDDAGGIWSGSFTSTGLSAGNQYLATLTQGDVEEVARFRTDFSVYTPCSVHVNSCFKTSGNGSIELSMERHQRTYSTLPKLANLFIDDIGYTDALQCDDSAGTGHATAGSPWSTNTQYTAWVAWLCYLGMLEDTSDSNIALCRDEDHVYVLRNENFIPMKGDHEYFNEINFTGTTTGATPDFPYPNPIHTDATNSYDGHMHVVWEQLMVPLKPPLLKNDSTLNGGAGARDTIAEHVVWSLNGGYMGFMHLDGILRGSGDASTSPFSQITTLYGNDQIDDVLEAVGNLTTPFLVELSNRGLVRINSQQITQQEVKRFQPTEYARIYTDAGGLMALTRANGVNGTFVRVQGDSHIPSVSRQYDTAGTNNEWFDNWCLGTQNGSSPRAITPVAGDDDGTVEMLYTYENFNVSYDGVHNRHSMIRIDMKTAEEAMDIHIVDHTNESVFSRRYTRLSGNDAQAIDYIPATSIPISSGGDVNG